MAKNPDAHSLRKVSTITLGVVVLGAFIFPFYEAGTLATKVTKLKTALLQIREEANPPKPPARIEKVEPYELETLVLSTKRYWDKDADLVPVDLALAWGPLTDPQRAKKILVRQSNRFFYWNLPPNQPISAGEVISNTANVHMVSLNAEQTKTLKSIKKGDLIHLQGSLVNIHLESRTWKTSRSRTDTGDGACEIFLTEEIKIIKRNQL